MKIDFMSLQLQKVDFDLCMIKILNSPQENTAPTFFEEEKK